MGKKKNRKSADCFYALYKSEDSLKEIYGGVMRKFHRWVQAVPLNEPSDPSHSTVRVKWSN